MPAHVVSDSTLTRAPRQAARLDIGALTTWVGIARLAHNDFEAVVAPRYPEVERALDELRASAARDPDTDTITLLAGSGATVFAVSSAPVEAMTMAHGTSVRLVHTRTASRVVAVGVSD